MDSDIKLIWRDRLKQRLTETGRSMRDVSLKAGLGPNFTYDILVKGREPSIQNLIAVASELNVSMAYLMGERSA